MKRSCVLLFIVLFVFCNTVYADIPSIVIDGEVVTTVPDESVVDKAVAFAMDIAMDDSHGYSNGSEFAGPGTYNCIGLVLKSYQVAGYDMGFCWIGALPDKLLSYGFTDVTDIVDVRTGAGAQKGDVFWMMHEGGKHGHTEIMGDNGVLIGARGLGNNDTIPGDQDGNEISVVPFFSYHWERVFRPPASLCSPAIVIEDVTEPIVMDDGIVIEPIISDDVVVNDVTKMTEFGERTVSDVGLMWYCCFKKLYCF